MSRTVPRADPWSRQNDLERRTAALERGLSVIPTTGSFAQGPFSTASTSPVTVDGTPTVSVAIGPAGDVRLSVSAELTTPAINGQAAIYLGGAKASGSGGSGIDSFTPQLFCRLLGVSSILTANVSATRTFSGWFGLADLNPGQWTFSLALGTSNPGAGAASFVAVYLEAVPL